MKFIFLGIIRFYQLAISPMLHAALPVQTGCRYYPTCSEYTYQKVKKLGVIKGIPLGIKRFLSCNPLGKIKHQA